MPYCDAAPRIGVIAPDPGDGAGACTDAGELRFPGPWILLPRMQYWFAVPSAAGIHAPARLV